MSVDFKALVAGLPQDTFISRCIAQLPIGAEANFTRGAVHLVNGLGQSMDTFSNATWGITLRDCYQYCGTDQISYKFDFQVFAPAFTNFLLPWLALTAQLPYETSTPWDNLMSLCLSVGSPALCTYSLVLTILNRYSLRTRWHALLKTSMSRAVRDKYSDFSIRIKAIQYLLQEAQQVPLRASQEKGWLSSLIVSPKNQQWWWNVQRRLTRTRRSVTLSMVAQILAASMAWLFVVASGFIVDRGDRVVANMLSSGTLWLWLVPVIWGWVTVGTQASSDAIDEALRADVAYRVKEPPIAHEGSMTEKAEQRAIKVRSGLAVQPHRAGSNAAAFEVPDEANLNLSLWLGADIIGDEKKEGPIFNYARVFTWWQLATVIERALETTVHHIDAGRACKPSDKEIVAWSPDRRVEDNLAGDSYTTAQYSALDLDQGQVLAYPEWSEVPSGVWKRVVIAGIFALFVLWGTTGPGVLIAYHTPTKGIGCRTASYILFGCLATTVWVLLMASMMFSHAAMLRYQREHKVVPGMNFRRHSNLRSANVQLLGGYERTKSHALLCGLAVVTRLLGKTIAVANTMWLIATALLEYTGVYDRCYCRGNEIGLGLDKGWLVLFKTEDDLSNIAISHWAGGVAMSILVCVVSYLFFWLGSRRSLEEKI